LPAAHCRARTWAGDGGVLGAGAEGRERGGASGRVERSGTGGRGTVARSGKASLQVCARPAQASQNARSLGGTNGCPYEHLGGSGPVVAPFKRVPAGVLVINGGRPRPLPNLLLPDQPGKGSTVGVSRPRSARLTTPIGPRLREVVLSAREVGLVHLVDDGGARTHRRSLSPSTGCPSGPPDRQLLV